MKAIVAALLCMVASAFCFPQESWQDRGASYLTLASEYLQKGEGEKAYSCYEEALVIYREALGEESNMVAVCYTMFALIDFDWGKTAQALENFQKSIEIKTAIQAEPDVLLGHDYYYSGQIYQAHGDTQSALESYAKAIQTYVNTVGEIHNSTADACYKAAKILDDMAEYEDAVEFFQYALEIQKELYGENNVSVVDLYNSIGIVLNKQKKYEQTLEYFNKVLEIRKEIYGEQNRDVAAAYYNIGQVLLNQGNYTDAILNYKKALEIFFTTVGENNSSTAAAYNDIAIAYNKLGEYEQSLEYHEKALKIRINLYGENSASAADSYNNIGIVLYDQGKYEFALEKYQKALEIRESVYGEMSSAVIASYNNIGIVLDDLSRYEEALYFLNKSLELKKSLSGETNEEFSEHYINIGRVFQHLGKYEQSLEHYQKAIEIGIAVYGEKNSVVSDCYMNAASVLLHLGDSDKAYKYNKKSIEIKEALYGKKHPNLALAYSNMAVILAELDDYESAVNYGQKAIEIQHALYGENHPNLAFSYNSMGDAFYRQGNLNQALEYFQKALDIVKNTYGENRPDVLMYYGNIAMVHASKGDYDNALLYYTRKLDICKNLHGTEHPEIANTYSDICSMLFLQGNYTQAFEYGQKALAISKAIYGEDDKNNPSVAKVYNNAAIALKTGNAEQRDLALEYFQKALEIYKAIYGEKHSSVAAVYMNIGTIYGGQLKFDLSLPYFEKALEIETALYSADSPKLSNLYFASTISQLAVDKTKAADYFNGYISSLAASMEYMARIGEIKRLLLIAQDYAVPDFLEPALDAGVALAERARLDMSSMKTDVMRQSLPLYYYGVSFESGRGNAAKAFEYSEGLRNRGFLDQLGTETALGLDGITQEERDRIRSLIDEITAARNVMNQQTDPQNEYNDARYRNAGDRLAKAEKELAALDEEIGKRLPAYAQLRNPQPVSADAAKNWCGNKRTVLEYILPPADNDGLEESACCIVITGNDIRAVPLDSEYDYTSAVAGLRDAVTEQEQGLYAGKSAAIHRYRSALYEKLIQPVMQHIPGRTERLVIVPDGSLSALPFDILGNDEDGLLGERYAISFSPSVSVSVLKETADRTGFSMLGIGNAVYSGPPSSDGKRGSIQLQNANADDYDSVAEYYRKNLSEWSMLKGSGEELRNIKTLIFPGEKVDIYEQEKATEQVIKALSRSGELAGYEQILMACHGYFNAAKPEMSALVFSEVSDEPGRTAEDGYLTVDEIALLKMNAEFLNLSACQTALAVVRHGDGMTGLTRSCIIAGAENVGVTLWEVNDEAACQFQEYLYGFIKAGVPYPEAYRKAKMAMLKSDDWQEPLYWSAFVLYE